MRQFFIRTSCDHAQTIALIKEPIMVLTSDFLHGVPLTLVGFHEENWPKDENVPEAKAAYRRKSGLGTVV